MPSCVCVPSAAVVDDAKLAVAGGFIGVVVDDRGPSAAVDEADFAVTAVAIGGDRTPL